MSSMYGGRGATGASSGRMGGYQKTGSSGTHEFGRMQQFTPEQMQLFQQMFGHLGPDSFTGRLAAGDEDIFNQIEAPALKQFAGLQGNIASRFSGMGSGGRKSSGFQNTMNQAGSDFASGLQSQRQGLQSQAIKDLMGMSGQLLQQRPYESFANEKKPSFLDSIMGGVGNLGGQAGSLGLLKMFGII